MRRALTLVAALTLGTAPLTLTAGATTAPPLTLTQQARKADVIVRATLGPATSVKEGDVTWQVYPLTVTETVAGDAASLPQQDGKPALYLLSGAEGLPDLRAGQEAFLLLYSRKLDSPVVGFTQGFYPIENGRVTRPGTGAGGAASTAPASPGTPAATATPATTTASPTTPATQPATQTPASATQTPATPTPATPTTPATGSATAPATTSPPAATATPAAPAPTDPDAIESDPAKFRDALRAARGAQ